MFQTKVIWVEGGCKSTTDLTLSSIVNDRGSRGEVTLNFLNGTQFFNTYSCSLPREIFKTL